MNNLFASFKKNSFNEQLGHNDKKLEIENR